MTTSFSKEKIPFDKKGYYLLQVCDGRWTQMYNKPIHHTDLHTLELDL